MSAQADAEARAMTDTIRAALDASVRAYCCADGECPCDHYSACLIAPNADTRNGITQAIAAFHRHRALDLRGAGLTPVANAHDEIAAAVEAAAKEAGQ
jgi:hypothetical protein